MPRRIDANQNEVVKKLRQCGVSVQILSAVGNGCPDLLCGFHGRTVILELKDGDKAGSRRKLTVGEHAWHANWSGQVDVVRDFEEALDVILRVARGG